ncbi:hypothetical protein HFC70_04570 [Agrobacterium sp. a22-2]|uniref:hypothetical protein n=1 Tax=Agrobacterium sp. a22-2 TaxID=2283840 RepID=UPI00144583D5|nr:hypothetical protein [Agrobacterium sp. a22-2]NKN35625.1 hypothetical protein [Agrobacterium sp. a22-2]
MEKAETAGTAADHSAGKVFPNVFRHSSESWNPATARLRREKIYSEQGLDRAGSRIKCGMTDNSPCRQSEQISS